MTPWELHMSEPTIVTAIVTSDEDVLLGRRPMASRRGRSSLERSRAMSHHRRPERECMEETRLPVVAGEILGARDHPKTGRHMVYVACRPANGTQVMIGDLRSWPRWRGASCPNLTN